MDVDEPLVERTIELAAPLDDVWAAITQRDQLSAWVGGEVTELDVCAGGRGSVRRADGAMRRLLVESVDLGRRLVLRWWPFEDGFPTGPASGTRVEFLLEPTEGGTSLRVVERAPFAAPGAFAVPTAFAPPGAEAFAERSAGPVANRSAGPIAVGGLDPYREPGSPDRRSTLRARVG
jgi:uncharacterized protein YndB with AHSA1/START domain